jgi:hypothetical protein
MKYSNIAKVARTTTGLGRTLPVFPQRIPATRSYASASPGTSHLVRNGLLAAGLLGAAGATYLYPDMFGFGGESAVEDDSKSKLETLYVFPFVLLRFP